MMDLETLFRRYKGEELYIDLSKRIHDENALQYIGLKSVTLLDEGYYRVLMGLNKKSQQVFDMFAENALEIIPKKIIEHDIELAGSLKELEFCGLISTQNDYYITLTERGMHMLTILLMRNALQRFVEEEVEEVEEASKPPEQQQKKKPSNPNVLSVDFDMSGPVGYK